MPLSGVLLHNGKPVGGLAIPVEASAEFIDNFNQRYASVGLSARLLEPAQDVVVDDNAPPQSHPNPHNEQFEQLDADRHIF